MIAFRPTFEKWRESGTTHHRGPAFADYQHAATWASAEFKRGRGDTYCIESVDLTARQVAAINASSPGVETGFPPVFDLAPNETTTQALRRLGFGHRDNGKGNYTREIYRISDGLVIGSMLASGANEWIRSGCPVGGSDDD